MKKKLNLAIIGCGNIAKYHIKAFNYLGLKIEHCASKLNSKRVNKFARKYNIPNSYELLKDASRGKKITKTELHNIISKLNIPEHEKDKLFDLTPTQYIGLSSKLCNG